VQFVETDMGLMVDAKLIGMMGGFVPMEMVVEGKSACFLVLWYALAKRVWVFTFVASNLCFNLRCGARISRNISYVFCFLIGNNFIY
jgi:hypothetical protein